jgi:hypothetical protein
MIPISVETMLSDPTKEAIQAMLDDQKSVFLVDWREEDDAIVGYCEEILKTGALSAEIVDIDGPGFAGYLTFRGKRVRFPWVVGTEDRHITLHTLNEVLMPEFEIRVCVDSNGSDTLAFLPLSGEDWKALEAAHGERVAKHFRKIKERPNLFTEQW